MRRVGSVRQLSELKRCDLIVRCGLNVVTCSYTFGVEVIHCVDPFGRLGHVFFSCTAGASVSCMKGCGVDDGGLKLDLC